MTCLVNVTSTLKIYRSEKCTWGYVLFASRTAEKRQKDMHNYAALTATGIPLTSGLPRAALFAETTVVPYNGRPVPIDLIFFVYRTCCDILAQYLLCQLLLLLRGDVELNPGPTKSADLAAILTTIKELQGGQAAILEELNELKEAHDAHKGLLTSFTDRVTKLESFNDHPLAEPVSIESGNLKHDIAALKAASVDVSNRLRRNNLLFLGIDDTDKETWKDSEDKVLAFCKDKLSFEIFPNSIERAHRIGSPYPEKNRPIIVKFMNFKTKEEILSCGPKLKKFRALPPREEGWPAKLRCRAST